MQNKAPFKAFSDFIKGAENPKDHHIVNGNIFKKGDMVYGTWVNDNGSTFYQDGEIIGNGITGLWVQSLPDGGITEIKRFIFLNHQKPKQP